MSGPSPFKFRLNALILSVAGIAIFSPFARAADTSIERAAILAPVTGDSLPDQEIRRLQGKITDGRNADAYLIRLGWAFVAKARVSSDPGYYKLAELCARTPATQDETDALLLRGHIADALHRFADAETIGRNLSRAPHARWEALALLGDALMEQGKLEAAITAYQRMIDIRPCAQTYARVAHVRWLKGDLDGALELMRMAVEASSTRDPEPAAWAYTRLGLYQLQAGNLKEAGWSAQRANEFVADYPAALVLQAKLLVNQNKIGEALSALRRAAAASPLPECQWFLADAARAVGDNKLATETEAAICSRGRAEDSRSFALFLATRQESTTDALEAARQELNNRHDVFTYDALAWASFASGRLEDAVEFSKQALSEGTRDARLQAHAAIIAAANHSPDASALLKTATSLRPLLLPSERQLLDALSVPNYSAARAAARSTSPTPVHLSSR